MDIKRFGPGSKILWKDRKRWCGMPLSFTRYILIDKENAWTKLFSSIGLLFTLENEVNLYRVFDVSVYRSLTNKIFGVGTITLYCNDDTNPEVKIIRVKEPYKVRDLIAELVERERQKRHVAIAEIR